MTRSQEMLIRGVAGSLRSAAFTLESLLAREEPGETLPACPKCGSTDLAEAGGDHVCAKCNHNFQI